MWVKKRYTWLLEFPYFDKHILSINLSIKQKEYEKVPRLTTVFLWISRKKSGEMWDHRLSLYVTEKSIKSLI